MMTDKQHKQVDDMAEMLARIGDSMPDAIGAALSDAIDAADIPFNAPSAFGVYLAGFRIATGATDFMPMERADWPTVPTAQLARILDACNAPAIRALVREHMPAEATDKHVDLAIGAACMKLGGGAFAAHQMIDRVRDAMRVPTSAPLLAPMPKLPC